MSEPESRHLQIRYRGRIIEHLTVQTYQSPVAAVAEIVANAWDADAATVEVTLPAALGPSARLVVADDGIGMTFEECQDRYLAVGFARRGDNPTTPSETRKRPVMGRKGIGKFAGFGIANVMIVDTVSTATGERTIFQLDYDRLRGDSDEYVDEEPTDVNDVKWYPKGEHDAPPGTRIELRSLKLRQAISPVVMRRSLARRFLLLERADQFHVKVNGEPIADEQDESGVQFSYPSAWPAAGRPPGLTVAEDGWGEEEVGGHPIRWRVVFYNDTIKDEDLRGISVFAHGKMAQRPFFFDVGSRGGMHSQVGQQYLSGQVDAPFLDEAPDDLISIERQRVDWNDPVAEPLLTWGAQRVRELLALWNEGRVETKIAQLDSKIARFSPRLDKLPSRERKIVEGAIRKFASVRVLTNEQFVTLSEGTLTAWEGGRLKELIHDVADTERMSEEDLLSILVEHQVLTALHTAEAVRAKKSVVSGLRDRIRNRDLENAVRDYIASNPWLIDPKWETFKIETSLKKLVDETAKKQFSKEMLEGRIDLLLWSGDQLLVLEFMRPGLKIDRDHLSRFDYYVNSLRVNLNANSGGRFNAVTGYIIADRIERDPALVATVEGMRSDGKFTIEWEHLLAQAAKHWEEFFEALAERAPDDERLRDLSEQAEAEADAAQPEEAEPEQPADVAPAEEAAPAASGQ